MAPGRQPAAPPRQPTPPPRPAAASESKRIRVAAVSESPEDAECGGGGGGGPPGRATPPHVTNSSRKGPLPSTGPPPPLSASALAAPAAVTPPAGRGRIERRPAPPRSRAWWGGWLRREGGGGRLGMQAASRTHDWPACAAPPPISRSLKKIHTSPSLCQSLPPLFLSLCPSLLPRERRPISDLPGSCRVCARARACVRACVRALRCETAVTQPIQDHSRPIDSARPAPC